MGHCSFARGALRGDVAVPGDKSISHRALIIAAKSREPVMISNLNLGLDVRATTEALRLLGVRVDITVDTATVHGGALHSPSNPMNCMNSGSTARMMLGACAGAALHAQLDGDASLRARPMEPVAAQLRAFGAQIETAGGMLPATITGSRSAQTTKFTLVSPSAQVKTSLLLAGLFAEVSVTILADKGSRDHTERMLKYLGAEITFDRTSVALHCGPRSFAPITIPGDFSAAAFFIVAACVTKGSHVRIPGVGINPTRTGLLNALQQMGADIEIHNQREICGEPVGDIIARYAPLRGVAVGPDLALRAIDEMPALAMAAAFASGTTRITGIRDLRVKESDRISAIERLLMSVGISSEALSNGIAIHGGMPGSRNGAIETHGDHRTVMAAAALAAGAGTLEVDDASSAAVSFPNFLETWRAAQMGAA